MSLDVCQAFAQVNKKLRSVPFDGKASHSGLISQYIPPHTSNVRLGGWVCVELLGVILVVDVVPNANEFTVVIATREEDHSDPKDFGRGNAVQIRRIGLEDEFVCASRYGSN